MGGGQESPGSVTALGDSAAALASARPVTQAELPTAERQARFCIGTARGWQQHGRPDQAYQALLAAERHVPEEIRRGSVRMLITHDGTGTRRGLTASANLPRAQGASLIRREHEGGLPQAAPAPDPRLASGRHGACRPDWRRGISRAATCSAPLTSGASLQR